MTFGRLTLALLFLSLPLTAFGDAAAARAIRADYSVSVRGLPVGKAKLRAEIADRSYSISFSGGISGIVRLFTDLHTSAQVSGEIGDDRPRATDYSHVWVEGDEEETVTMHFAGDGVTGIAIKPPIKRPERYVPITAADEAQALDLVSAFLWPAASGAAPEACNRTLPLIDGRRRFDIVFGFRRMDSLKMGNGWRHYRAAVCSLQYRPIAGQRKDKKNDGFLSDGGDAEVWLASAGGGLVVPIKVKLSTRLGGVVMQATKLEAE